MSLLDSSPDAPASPDAPTSFDPSTFLDEGGVFKEGVNWEQALAPLGADVSPGHISKYKNLGDFFKGHANVVKLATGKNQGLVPPTSAEDTAGIQAWREGLGVPSSSSEYEISAPEGLPEGVEFDREAVEPYLEILHKHHATPELVQDLINLDAKTKAGLAEQMGVQSSLEADKAVQAEHEALKGEFGAGLPEVLSRASRAAIAIGIDPKDGGLFNTAERVKSFNLLADKLGEDNLPNSVQDAAKTKQAQAMGIMQNKPGFEELSKRYYAGDEEVNRMVQAGLAV